jgi:hypothetical protein
VRFGNGAPGCTKNGCSRGLRAIWIDNRVKLSTQSMIFSFNITRFDRLNSLVGLPVLMWELRPSRWQSCLDRQTGGKAPKVDGDSPFPRARRKYLGWATRFLEITTTREPNFCCFGLHEWAMIYREKSVRHSEVPLRLEGSEIASLVEAQGLGCTHFDAFRFFTEPARKRNRTALSRETTINMDQRGCIHVSMDLYRFCYKIAPWIESELLVDAFELARFAREIDMRASPYDLRSIGFAPIRVETADGRAEYVRLQRKISERAKPIRQRVLLAYQRLWDGFR